MRALVVGAGRMGRFHCRALRDLGLDVTTVDRDPAAGADHVTVPMRSRFDVVCIAVPIDQLADEASAWEGHEGWMLIEKPGAPTAQAAHDLAHLLDGQRVAIGYVERFNPQVRTLRRLLDDAPPPVSARFRRWGLRVSSDVTLDLLSHDIDLTHHLDLRCPAVYETESERGVTVREVKVWCESGLPIGVDLTAHDTSPLHAQWHAFLAGRGGYATPADAIDVLTRLEQAAAAAA